MLSITEQLLPYIFRNCVEYSTNHHGHREITSTKAMGEGACCVCFAHEFKYIHVDRMWSTLHSIVRSVYSL